MPQSKNILTGLPVVVGLIAATLGSAPSVVRAQEVVFTACYVPDVGVVYLIKAESLPEACIEATHVEFSWTSAVTLESTTVERAVVVGPAAIETISDLSCPAGWFATGGGWEFDLSINPRPEFNWLQNQPSGEAGWLFTIHNENGAQLLSVSLYIHCIRPVP